MSPADNFPINNVHVGGQFAGKSHTLLKTLFLFSQYFILKKRNGFFLITELSHVPQQTFSPEMVSLWLPYSAITLNLSNVIWNYKKTSCLSSVLLKLVFRFWEKLILNKTFKKFIKKINRKNHQIIKKNYFTLYITDSRMKTEITLKGECVKFLFKINCQKYLDIYPKRGREDQF